MIHAGYALSFVRQRRFSPLINNGCVLKKNKTQLLPLLYEHLISYPFTFFNADIITQE